MNTNALAFALNENGFALALSMAAGVVMDGQFMVRVGFLGDSKQDAFALSFEGVGTSSGASWSPTVAGSSRSAAAVMSSPCVRA